MDTICTSCGVLRTISTITRDVQAASALPDSRISAEAKPDRRGHHDRQIDAANSASTPETQRARP
jgi:hypothetical protein